MDMDLILLKETLLKKTRQAISDDDPSHDFHHAKRICALAERIAKAEKADLEIVIPSALFHDAVNYQKNDPRTLRAPEESAELIAKILKKIKDYPPKKIKAVVTAICQCSFSRGIMPKTIEGKILQDADRLEATGAISIMRTFASTGCMQRPFYSPEDPFCIHREPTPKQYALDLFYARLLKVGALMHTKLGRKLAKPRTKFLQKFLKELKVELGES